MNGPVIFLFSLSSFESKRKRKGAAHFASVLLLFSFSLFSVPDALNLFTNKISKVRFFSIYRERISHALYKKERKISDVRSSNKSDFYKLRIHWQTKSVQLQSKLCIIHDDDFFGTPRSYCTSKIVNKKRKTRKLHVKIIKSQNTRITLVSSTQMKILLTRC